LLFGQFNESVKCTNESQTKPNSVLKLNPFWKSISNTGSAIKKKMSTKRDRNSWVAE